MGHKQVSQLDFRLYNRNYNKAQSRAATDEAPWSRLLRWLFTLLRRLSQVSLQEKYPRQYKRRVRKLIDDGKLIRENLKKQSWTLMIPYDVQGEGLF